MILEKWMICNLEKFGNCIISGKFYQKHGDLKIVEAVKSLGYQDVHVLEKIRTHQPANRPGRPKLIKTYIIETQIKREETHTEVKKMQKFNIGDKVEIIDGTLKGKMGTVEEVEKNDVGDYTYGIKVPSVYSYLGLTAKQTAQLRLEKAAGKKRGRPAKAKEVTKQVVEMTEAEPKTEGEPKPTTAVDEAVEVVDEAVEVVDKVDELFDEVAIEPKSEPKAYDQLREVYDELCKKLTFVELSSFYDIVAKDMKTSKYVLEQMYQMSIEQLAKIREEIA